jgi:hypothetical protein
MKNRFFRLVIFLSVVASVLCSIAGVLQFIATQDFERATTDAIHLRSRAISECREEKRNDCAEIELTNSVFTQHWISMSQAQNSAKGNSILCLIGAVGIPALLFSLYFSVLWIFTGTIKNSR